MPVRLGPYAGGARTLVAGTGATAGRDTAGAALMSTAAFIEALGDLAHAGAHPRPGVCSCAPAQVLADRADGTVVRRGVIAAKAHAPDADTAALAARLALAAAPSLAGILLPPLPAPASTARPVPRTDAVVGGGGVARPHRPAARVPFVLDGRPVSLWPHGTPVDPSDPGVAPWEEAGGLLARLHRTVPPLRLPSMRGPVKAALAVARMCTALPEDPATLPVLAAWHGLPAWARGDAPMPPCRAGYVCHGDLHLGQLVRHPAPDGPWLLIDVDDAGLGDPAWDLARPAAWYAAGLLPPDVWLRFLDSYRAAGGPAVRPDGDPWPELDVPARTLTVQTAALAFAKSAAEGRTPDEVEQLMIDACARIASLPPELAAEHSS